MAWAGSSRVRFALFEDQSDPVGQPHAGSPQRLLELAELQVRVRVDQPRQQDHVA